jgi:hypothetical protein
LPCSRSFFRPSQHTPAGHSPQPTAHRIVILSRPSPRVRSRRPPARAVQGQHGRSNRSIQNTPSATVGSALHRQHADRSRGRQIRQRSPAASWRLQSKPIAVLHAAFLSPIRIPAPRDRSISSPRSSPSPSSPRPAPGCSSILLGQSLLCCALLVISSRLPNPCIASSA